MVKSPVVVITGASAGVGRATARAFAVSGARIGLIARDEERLDDVVQEVRELGGDALALPLDVADPAAVDHAATVVEEAFGPIDVWVNNAMVSVFSPFEQITPAEFRRVTEVTYLGTVHGTQAALRRMRPRDRGTIVQVGSALAERSIPLQSACCGAKHAVQGFTDSIRSELIHDKSDVHLTMVQLPAINTPQFSWAKSRLPRQAQPVPPIYQPEVAAQAIVWAARHRRREVVLGWPTMKAILGDRLAPWYADRRLASRAWEGQQTHRAADPARPDNLWTAVPGRFGAHGDFDQRAISRSRQFWFVRNRGWLIPAAVTVGAAAVILSRRRATT